ncbi:MAG: hypothetical protein MR995_03100 [Fusobacterium mortiferum]|uniref:Uncharacterized protein n=1 Tax=Fusobacterium mortiferum ATCC 9817 TaxID=469616 RepID=A0ABM6TZL7_FUSMR|nr:hypothetical protein [Fusobacterium mortiferum]AVQ19917.1 hypothetical protein C4N19_12790 [Fusobacterium mortiferum ATCC 9817]EEO35641.1 hypothetical protein FMAG_01203 [Fusobacterium mortiferum ATCC 9817]MCI7187112.1 hypothetical protein [Fusobacterium mortiferum]RGM98313.1 hypothetical protein DXB84_07355 [Fusobacterium mortiferum]
MERKECNEILKFSTEVILQVFVKINKRMEELKNNDEISALEILQNEVIPKYEKLYKGLKTEIKDDEEIDIEKFENIKKYIYDIMKENSFTEEFIRTQMKLRERFQGESGAEVVKKLFEYEKKQMENTKYNLLDKVNKVLDREDKLAMDLKNAIQEEEQIECIYKLQPVREEYRALEEKVLRVQKNIDDLKKKLDSEWTYEIYGTISKDEMLNTYNQTMKK